MDKLENDQFCEIVQKFVLRQFCSFWFFWNSFKEFTKTLNRANYSAN